jgi:D-amino-acid dehydrogenase
MTDTSQDRIIIVGAGIVGAAIGFELASRGHNVLVLDRGQPGMGTSFGNMACIAVSGFMAVSRPSTWKKIPGWMLDPVGPVAVRPSYALKALPWFLRFMAAGRPARVDEIDRAMALLAKAVLGDLVPFLEKAGASDILTNEGCLSIYETEEEFQNDAEALRLFSQYGFDHQILSGKAIRDVEPALSGHIPKAVVLPDNRTIRDPYQLLLRLITAMVAKGGTVDKGHVLRIDKDEQGKPVVVLDDRRQLKASKVILAAGVETRTFAAQLGEPIPLETERGYHTQIMDPGLSMSWSVIWPRRAFMITPTAGGIRVGGSVEMAGLAAAPNYKRADVLVHHAQRAIPELKIREATQWMGHRPALPDTLPIISASSKMDGVYYATGHGHLGLTHAATTAKRMGDLIDGRDADPDMAALSIGRF